MTDTYRYVLSAAMLAVLLHLSEARPSTDQMAEYRVPWVDDGQLTAQDEIYIGKLIEGLKGLNRLERYGMQNKRGLDFGLGRGFSGSQAAKHLMGMASANFAGGPGRKRRSPAAQEN